MSSAKAHELSQAIQNELDTLSGTQQDRHSNNPPPPRHHVSPANLSSVGASPIFYGADLTASVVSGELHSAERSAVSAHVAQIETFHHQQRHTTQNHSLVSSHNNSTTSTGGPPPPTPTSPPPPPSIQRLAAGDDLRLQQLLREKLGDTLGSSSAKLSGRGDAVSASGNNFFSLSASEKTGALSPPPPLSFSAGGGAAKFTSISETHTTKNGSASPPYSSHSSRPVAPTTASMLHSQHQHNYTAATLESGEVFELRKALLAATATSEQLKLALHTEKQKVVLLEHTINLRESEMSSLQNQLQADSAKSASDRQKAAEVDRSQHDKIVQLHGEIERYATQLRQAHQDIEREKIKRNAIEHELEEAREKITNLAEENSLLRDFLKRRNIQYERLKEFIVGPMKNFVETAAHFQGQWSEASQPAERFLSHQDEMDEESRGGDERKAQSDDFAAVNYQGFGTLKKQIAASGQRHWDEVHAVTRRVEEQQKRNRLRQLQAAVAGKEQKAPGPNFDEVDGGANTTATAASAHSNATPSSSSSDSSSSEDDQQERGKESQHHHHLQPISLTESSGDKTVKGHKPAAVATPTSPAWIANGTQSYHHQVRTSNVISVASKALMPTSQSRVQNLYDPARNRELLTDEELERRVAALLARARNE